MLTTASQSARRGADAGLLLGSAFHRHFYIALQMASTLDVEQYQQDAQLGFAQVRELIEVTM